LANTGTLSILYPTCVTKAAFFPRISSILVKVYC
jgi:hypothetical protein